MKSSIKEKGNPYQNYPKGKVVTVHGVEVKVGYQNQGITWLSPTKDDPTWNLYQSLSVFKVMPNGEIKEIYKWG